MCARRVDAAKAGLGWMFEKDVAVVFVSMDHKVVVGLLCAVLCCALSSGAGSSYMQPKKVQGQVPIL